MIGAGERGYAAYGPYALEHPDELRFVAVAEPIKARRERFAAAHSILREARYGSWDELMARGQMAHAAFICTMDQMHAEPAIAALQAGYHVLLEKPIATTWAECVRVVETAERTDRILQVSHVLRYTPFFSALHDVIASGRLGKIVGVEHRENVVYWHTAHSYVRGNWRRREESSPIILAKCSHDLDILAWNLGPCRQLSSFAPPRYFRPENAPDGAPPRCTDGCPAAGECPWFAPRLYLDLVPLLHVARQSPNLIERAGARMSLRFPRLTRWLRQSAPPLERALDYRDWPISAISEDTSPAGRRRALEEGPYGRCVFHCDNNVVDHQTVAMQFECGASGTLVLNGHSHEEARTMRYDGTRATLRGKFAYGLDDVIEIHDHRTGEVERIDFGAGSAGVTGHGGGDEGLIRAFVRAVRGDREATSPRQALESHLMAFAADRARLEGRVVTLPSP
jgi:predicted dehydrogenase